MKKTYKYLLVLLFVFCIMFIFSNTSIVKADNDNPVQDETINLDTQVDAKKLEEIKSTKLKVLLTPRFKVEAAPEQEDISKYYYNQLTHDIARNTYNALTNQISNSVEVNLNDFEVELEDTSSEGRINYFKDNLLPFIYDGYEAYIMDGAENYWWTSQSLYINKITTNTNNNMVVYKTLLIQSKATEYENREEFNSKLEEVCNSITGNTIYEVAKSINNYINNNVEYKVLEDSTMEQSAYGALVLNKAVCEGQGQLFNIMCRKKGIQSINVYGWTKDIQEENNTDAIAHAWNYIYHPTKKQWYAVDVTWNTHYKDSLYFMVGSDTVINGVKFSKNHFAGFKQFVAQTYNPATPTISAKEYTEQIKITEDGKYITNIQPNTEYNEFLKEFINDAINDITVSEGDKEISSTDILKTGQTFSYGSANLKIVVLGDTNGDGKLKINDILRINRHRLKRIQLEDECLKAADANKDGDVNIKDILRINRYRLNRINEI